MYVKPTAYSLQPSRKIRLRLCIVFAKRIAASWPISFWFLCLAQLVAVDGLSSKPMFLESADEAGRRHEEI
jgi:hypothetical protein